MIYNLPIDTPQNVTVIYKNQDVKSYDDRYVLNAQGEYIKRNDCNHIWDQSDKPVYKGFHFRGELFEQIKNLFLGVIYPSMDLIDIVNRNWISEEKQQYDEQLKIAQEQLSKTRNALRVSSVTVLVAILTLFFSLLSFKSNVIMSPEQFDAFMEAIKETKPEEPGKQNRPQPEPDSLWM